MMHTILRINSPQDKISFCSRKRSCSFTVSPYFCIHLCVCIHMAAHVHCHICPCAYTCIYYSIVPQKTAFFPLLQQTGKKSGKKIRTNKSKPVPANSSSSSGPIHSLLHIFLQRQTKHPVPSPNLHRSDLTLPCIFLILKTLLLTSLLIGVLHPALRIASKRLLSFGHVKR